MVLQKKYVLHKNWFNSNVINNQYNKYAEYLSSCDLAEETIDWRLKHIRGFLLNLDKKYFSFKSLKQENIYIYLSSISDLSARTREHRAVCIRFFLNWLYDNKVISFNGTNILPKIKCNKRENLISFYSISEIVKLINSINVNEKNGKRDLSILLLCSIYGIRSKDLIQLKLNNIDWNANKINYVCHKNNYPMSLTMPSILRYSLINYLKNERYSSNLDTLFLKSENKSLNSHNLYNIVNKYFKKANIDIKGKRHGSHALRHSLAVSLVEDNYSLYEIASVLGHINVNDSKIYATVDINKLKNISLEVPKWKN